MSPKTRQRLLWRLEHGRHVVVDALEMATELRQATEVPVTVDQFIDHRDRRTKYRLQRI